MRTYAHTYFAWSCFLGLLGFKFKSVVVAAWLTGVLHIQLTCLQLATLNSFCHFSLFSADSKGRRRARPALPTYLPYVRTYQAYCKSGYFPSYSHSLPAALFPSKPTVQCLFTCHHVTLVYLRTTCRDRVRSKTKLVCQSTAIRQEMNT